MQALGFLVILHHVLVLLLIVRHLSTVLATLEKISQERKVRCLLVTVEVANKIAVRQRSEEGAATFGLLHEELQEEARDPSRDLLDSVNIFDVNRFGIFAQLDFASLAKESETEKKSK